MVDDWKPGDLALCVHSKDWVPNGHDGRLPDRCPMIISALAPTPGSTWRVLRVEMAEDLESSEGVLPYLALQGTDSRFIYDARLFRKIRDHEADAEDGETIALLSGQPIPVEA